MAVCFWQNVTASASTCDTTAWTTAATTISFTQWVQYRLNSFNSWTEQKCKVIMEKFEDRARIKSYRKSLFATKVKQTLYPTQRQNYTRMIPAKRNFKGKENQRR